MRWQPSDPAWQYQLLDRLPPDIDPGTMDEHLRLSPTERLERVRELVEFLEEVRRARGDQLSSAV